MQIKIKKGLDILLKGEPEQRISNFKTVSEVALVMDDYVGLKPRLLVAEGEQVEKGRPVVEDKNDSGIRLVAPLSGEVIAIHRGDRRALLSVVIRQTNPQNKQGSQAPALPGTLNPSEKSLAGQLQQIGLWTAFRTRPFNRTPASDSRPQALFITAMDTEPLAADPLVVIEATKSDFIAGALSLKELTAGPVFICSDELAEKDYFAVAASDDPEEQIKVAEFSGPHPAGLAGTHIHSLYPVGTGDSVWHIDYQDVIAIGRWALQKGLDFERVVALTGEGVKHPRLVKVPLGASLDEVLSDETVNSLNVQQTVQQTPQEINLKKVYQTCRVISGSVLSGRRVTAPVNYLGRYHRQLTLIPEQTRKKSLPWLNPWQARFSMLSYFQWGKNSVKNWTTAQQGRAGAMLSLEVFDTVCWPEILPVPLFKALLVKDTDTAQALGCLELAEEDLALSEFLCPAKSNLGKALRDCLTIIQEEG